jgi:poly-gamma-glutamate capsule biosynthesis protein CapA/YwtB (metallophosphatase superfamily)
MEWNEGNIPLTDGSSLKPDWSMVVCGDWAPTQGHISSIRQSAAGVYGDLLPTLRQADLSVVNLECVLVDDGVPIIKDGVPLKAPPDMINGLKAVPFSVVCLANNHIMDYGEDGLRTTLNTLQANQLTAIGAGLSLSDAKKPFKTQIQGVRVCILNAAEGEEGISTGGAGVAPLDIARLSEQIRAMRSTNDVVVMIAHAGREHVPFPPPYIQEGYRALIDAGADVVVAHHPHAAQGIEHYKQGVIAYSLGNFAFLYGRSVDYLWSKLGYMLQIQFAGSKLHSVNIIPYKILEDRLALLQDTDKTKFLNELKSFSDLLEDPHKMTSLWEAFADLWLENRFKEETNTWVASLLPAEDLIRAARGNMNTLPGLRGRIVRRSLRWFENWLRRSNTNRTLTNQQRHGAAILRNRFETLAHRQLHLTALERIMSNKAGTADANFMKMLQNWMSRSEL